MTAFRETFSRPSMRIKFIGLFDAVNSVPLLENAWLSRSQKAPYTVRSSAKVIRHAVSIDERRAKFRQDLLISGGLGEVAGKHRRSDDAQPSKLSEGPAWLAGRALNEPISHAQDVHNRQDIGEVWFAGGHADIGGGWARTEGEAVLLSHTTLVWMMHEAKQHGLCFDEAKMLRHNCVESAPSNVGVAYLDFRSALVSSYTSGVLHDCLRRSNGGSTTSVLLWRMLEYLPFRRMVLQPNGKWKAVRWPLPLGAARDIPEAAIIHHSVIRRMQGNPNYRPKNLLVGGGGRDKKHTQQDFSAAAWFVSDHEDDIVCEVYKRCDLKKQSASAEKTTSG